MNIKRMIAYAVYYGFFGLGFFLIQMALIANLKKDWQFILATIVIFFGAFNPLMNCVKIKIDNNFS